ncbi:hypothetical protein Cabys_1789 [Caldithrix abyssi DSM 13497]|uniref:Uncharacterized protein n=1 Tax=Caldithrix abyssi DSM 13497 TaxID=880073 RepID=A0A1J1C964_CALAY|nr:hypothetical protein Cabys_1789 [Caldithrix abyssi DSM 13497]
MEVFKKKCGQFPLHKITDIFKEKFDLNLMELTTVKQYVTRRLCSKKFFNSFGKKAL